MSIIVGISAILHSFDAFDILLKYYFFELFFQSSSELGAWIDLWNYVFFWVFWSKHSYWEIIYLTKIKALVLIKQSRKSIRRFLVGLAAVRTFHKTAFNLSTKACGNKEYFFKNLNDMHNFASYFYSIIASCWNFASCWCALHLKIKLKLIDM